MQKYQQNPYSIYLKYWSEMECLMRIVKQIDGNHKSLFPYYMVILKYAFTQAHVSNDERACYSRKLIQPSILCFDEKEIEEICSFIVVDTQLAHFSLSKELLEKIKDERKDLEILNKFNFINIYFDRFSKCFSYSEANNCYDALIVPDIERYTADNWQKLFEIMNNNAQIYGAWDVNSALSGMYKQAKQQLPTHDFSVYTNISRYYER
ncbi:hypothetical protein PVA44_05120 [Entomospira nematocerorum]|uniref:Uncharacterized protein n=1 Tax=Entomospira nematocerorum TaxID=2719987 RepID=A0A968GB28_9SPIO|nr:hypothetical protein [Entomospira nematocera]NIZ46597.1 hypothetical protein [Entomospira nematocera]WDI33605.1 hypothetical protein PVA44_05120 [Entomospira nematocera]